jgi:hypothetical protein
MIGAVLAPHPAGSIPVAEPWHGIQPLSQLLNVLDMVHPGVGRWVKLQTFFRAEPKCDAGITSGTMGDDARWPSGGDLRIRF